jgi:uncharacterized SAM-binding protein YcdF (DUF218 family)
VTQTLPARPASASRRRRRLRRASQVATVLLAALLIYVGITFVQVHGASQRDRSEATADAIIVLGAAQYDGRPSPALEGRLLHARDLWVEGVSDTIVVTGGKQACDRFTEAAAGYTYLRENGVPDESILREEQGHSTWESLAASARFLRERGMTSVVLVTDGYHALRVQAVADDLGLDASVSPSREGGSARELAKETIAVAVGRIVGYKRLVDLKPQGRDVAEPPPCPEGSR